ncbi:MAG: hypothetical protein RIM84_03735 [Alphaproteobacteria bacterium]
MSRDELRRVQALLNKVGGLLETDGLTGRNTRRAIREARALAGLPAGELADDALIDWLEAQPDPSPELPTDGVTFIASEEVGGRDFYERHAARPIWPGGASGITIGVGYDLRFSADIFEADWAPRLPAATARALRPWLGEHGSKAGADRLKSIRIPWTTAWQVFIGRSLPQFVGHTARAYPMLADLPGMCRAVLVSLVFNRGPGLEDMPGSDRRAEMRAIRDLLRAGKADQVPDQLLSMRRLWPLARGLRVRREREAALWAEGLSRPD